MTTYIHGTHASEQERLSTLNRLTNRPFLEFLGVRAGMRVLDVGCGLGILASQVAGAAPGVRVTGVERAPEQLARAVRAPNVEYLRGDAQWLEFPDETFDLVYARYLLEHVGDPERVVSEMRRVTRAGGRIAVAENDISLVRFDPSTPVFDAVWSAFARQQAALGGDALIGRRLYRLFRSAGLTQIELSMQPEVHWHGSPGFARWVENIIGNVESGRSRLGREPVEQAIEELRALLTCEVASANFVWNRAMAVR